MNEFTSKVYVRTDTQSRITRIEGQYSLPADLTGWTLIEEGEPCDRLNHAQNNYLDKPVYESHGIPQYKLADGAPVERTQAEIDADIAAIPAPPPTQEERLGEVETIALDNAYQIIMLQYGV